MNIELIASKDHPLGGFRLWRKGDKFAAVVMDDPDTLTDDPCWDLQNWLDNLPEPESQTFWPAERLYPIYYRNAQDHHACWNVCAHLQDFLPCNS
jgi:hypothetical protein